MSSIPTFKVSPQRKDPQTVEAVMPLTPYLVNYNDGEGRSQTRIVFATPDNKSVFILQEKIHGVPVAADSNQWFLKGFVERLSSGPKNEVESI